MDTHVAHVGNPIDIAVLHARSTTMTGHSGTMSLRSDASDETTRHAGVQACSPRSHILLRRSSAVALLIAPGGFLIFYLLQAS